MKRHLISMVCYTDRSPREAHYLYVAEECGQYCFYAGEVIGSGVAAGGGEGRFDLAGLVDMAGYRQFLNDIQCEWIDSILTDKELSEENKYLTLIERSKKSQVKKCIN
ncbi:hypothetical protein [Teredinibacter sp. KSP-S5-2]|uniref:hypothetical protein n=1 Tax=Teredinibacter sp. KSP-S5-2 TaxID=3034506 RepID=UPI002934C0FE|nr:hypothetical protein [Teredinibacter sp. KSP-S5-2]WNO10017.1 hypothetical protein P5V12_02410 [Teredinibacter sp. KSP-S5-2]